MSTNTIGIIGSGSWATAIAKILLDAGQEKLLWWVRGEETRTGITNEGHNPRHLSAVHLDNSRLEVSTNLTEIVGSASHVLLAVPSAYLHSVLHQLPEGALKDKQIISAVKGSIPDCCMSVSIYLEQCMDVPKGNICVLSGPSHAEEVGGEMPTFLTLASTNEALALEMQQAFSCRYVHTSVSGDTDGIERCGLAKNIYAIAAGICQGLGYGDNLKAVLTTAAAREISQLLKRHLPSKERDFYRPCYLGDLLVTCWSGHSRNRALGIAVAAGESPASVFARSGSVAEGYFSVKNMHQLATRMGTLEEVPIAECVYRILYEDASPRTEMDHLIGHLF